MDTFSHFTLTSISIALGRLSTNSPKACFLLLVTQFRTTKAVITITAAITTINMTAIWPLERRLNEFPFAISDTVDAEIPIVEVTY